MKELLDHYARYNHWANTRFVERLQREPDEVLDRPVSSSFPSLRTTLLHIRDAENVWWGRLTGGEDHVAGGGFHGDRHLVAVQRTPQSVGGTSG